MKVDDRVTGRIRRDGRFVDYCLMYGSNGRPLYVRMDDEVWLDRDLGVERWGWEDVLKDLERTPHR